MYEYYQYLNILQSSVPTKNYTSIAFHSLLSASCSSICNPSTVADDEVDLTFLVLGKGKNQEDSTKDLCDREWFFSFKLQSKRTNFSELIGI
jgi:hypothetical protein